ncbi:MAG TPA: transglycosylase SLT domain-containing protein [Gemmatimonadaceae bacterium]|nr:transglycosylase SLT domain-containing protein [Gemmatimonadaceae bacterium]
MALPGLGALLVAVWCTAGCDQSRADAEPAQDTTAIEAATDSVEGELKPETRELVLRAREYDRNNLTDSARMGYLAAADSLPAVADWLLLRAAGVTADSAVRAGLYERVRTPVARDRIAITEALARERMGDIAGAIRAFEAARAPVSAFRLRVARASDAAARAAVRREMVAYMATHRGSEPARDVQALFDQSFTPRTPQEELTLARTAAASGRAERAISGFAVAARAGLLNAQDRFTYGSMLARLNRHKDAIAQYRGIREPSSLAAAAQYQLARMQIASGGVGNARSTLRSITREWPEDTSAASALLLLADLAADDNRDLDARAALRDAARRFPASRHAPAALFRAGMISYIQREFRTAATEFREVADRYPRSADAIAARYWSGRALVDAGDRADAESAWRRVIAGEPGSYYTVLASRRLRVPLQLGDSGAVTVTRHPALQSGIGRAALLETLGMSVEARHEHDRLLRDAAESGERMLATGEAFAGTEHASHAIALGSRLLSEVGRNPRTYRVVYPVVELERISAESRAGGLDPALVASLIRQESAFNPRATSPVGARGLMQIMPRVGQQLAGRKGISGYTPDTLYNPAVNVALGTLHLRNMMAEYPNVERALAAYNAGGSRVRRWAAKAGAGDPEVFTERIPFVETRGYVRAIVRNRAFYQALYSW